MRARAVVVVALAAALLAGCGTTSPPAQPDGVGHGAIVPSVTLSVLACEPLAWCVAAGTNPTASTHPASVEVSAGGRGVWAPAATPAITGATLTAAACWSSGCLLGGAAQGGSILLLVNPAHKVASETASHPPGAGVAALSCTGPGRCLALVSATTDTAVFQTTDSGATWRQVSTLPLALPGATALACATPAECVAAGTSPGGATVVTSVDGGARWAVATIPGGYLTVTSVTCGSVRWCLATARRATGTSTLLRSTDGGRSWAPASTSVAAPAAVTCVAVPTCVVAGGGAGGGAIATGVRAPHERLLTLVYVPDPVIGVACATVAKCAAITPASTVSFVP